MRLLIPANRADAKAGTGMTPAQYAEWKKSRRALPAQPIRTEYMRPEALLDKRPRRDEPVTADHSLMVAYSELDAWQAHAARRGMAAATMIRDAIAALHTAPEAGQGMTARRYADRTIRYRLCMTPHERDMLDRLAATLDITRADVIRVAVELDMGK